MTAVFVPDGYEAKRTCGANHMKFRNDTVNLPSISVLSNVSFFNQINARFICQGQTNSSLPFSIHFLLIKNSLSRKMIKMCLKKILPERNAVEYELSHNSPIPLMTFPPTSIEVMCHKQRALCMLCSCDGTRNKTTFISPSEPNRFRSVNSLSV